MNNIYNISAYIKLSDTQNKVYSTEYTPKNIFVNLFLQKTKQFSYFNLKTIEFQVIEYENWDWINDIFIIQNKNKNTPSV